MARAPGATAIAILARYRVSATTLQGDSTRSAPLPSLGQFDQVPAHHAMQGGPPLGDPRRHAARDAVVDRSYRGDDVHCGHVFINRRA